MSDSLREWGAMTDEAIRARNKQKAENVPTHEGGSAVKDYHRLDEQVRRAVLQRCGGCCEDCGTKCQLTMHHLHYDTVGNESPDDLAGLCWECHQERHRDINGDYWLDEQEKETYWFLYWKELERD